MLANTSVPTARDVQRRMFTHLHSYTPRFRYLPFVHSSRKIRWPGLNMQMFMHRGVRESEARDDQTYASDFTINCYARFGRSSNCVGGKPSTMRDRSHGVHSIVLLLYGLGPVSHNYRVGSGIHGSVGVITLNMTIWKVVCLHATSLATSSL